MMNNSFTYKKLLALKKKVDAMPPPPFFASSKLLPADKAIMFTFEGRDYVGAHPDFWAKVAAPIKRFPDSLVAQEIVDLEIERHRIKDFFGPMISVMSRMTKEDRDEN